MAMYNLLKDMQQQHLAAEAGGEACGDSKSGFGSKRKISCGDYLFRNHGTRPLFVYEVCDIL